jgi:hypothetical protein
VVYEYCIQGEACHHDLPTSLSGMSTACACSRTSSGYYEHIDKHESASDKDDIYSAALATLSLPSVRTATGARVCWGDSSGFPPPEATTPVVTPALQAPSAAVGATPKLMQNIPRCPRCIYPAVGGTTECLFNACPLRILRAHLGII